MMLSRRAALLQAPGRHAAARVVCFGRQALAVKAYKEDHGKQKQERTAAQSNSQVGTVGFNTVAAAAAVPNSCLVLKPGSELCAAWVSISANARESGSGPHACVNPPPATPQSLLVSTHSPCLLLVLQDDDVCRGQASFPFSRPKATDPPKEYAQLRSKCPIAKVSSSVPLRLV